MPNYYTSTGVVSNSSVGVSGQVVGVSAAYNSTDSYTIKATRSHSPDLPTITMTGYADDDSSVLMTLSPESSISSSDVSKLLMLIVAVISGHTMDFNPLAYVKKHSLERHFKFS